MTTDELVNAVLLKATGQPEKPQWADEEYQRILGIANFYISAWQNEPNTDWSSLYDPEFVIATSLEGVRSYEIDRSEFNKFSSVPGDFITVGDSNFYIIPAELLRRYDGEEACIIANNKIIFARDFYGNEIGKEIKAPVYLKAQPLTEPISKVPVDNPYWLVTVCAAEYSRSDILLQGQYPNLINEANQLMSKMIENNSGQIMHINYGDIPGATDI